MNTAESAALRRKLRGRVADSITELRAKTLEHAPAAAAKREAGYTVRNATDEAVVRIYDEIWFLGVNAADLIRDLEAITAPRIRVEINSPGGDVFDGIAIYNALRSHPAYVTTRVDGIAASIASVIAQAGDRRVMLSSAQMMIHNAWGMTVGDHRDHDEMRQLLEQQDDVIAGIYASRSGRPRAGFRTLMDAETWLTDERAVAEGLADEVVEPARQTAAVSDRQVMAEVRAIYDRMVIEDEYRRFQQLTTDLEMQDILHNLVMSELYPGSTEVAHFVGVGESGVPQANRQATAAVVTFCTTELGLKAQPAVRFFMPEGPLNRAYREEHGHPFEHDGFTARASLAGRADRETNTIWIRADLSVTDVMQTVAHECRHLAQQPHHTATDPLGAYRANELDARAYQRAFADSYLDREN